MNQTTTVESLLQQFLAELKNLRRVDAPPRPTRFPEFKVFILERDLAAGSSQKISEPVDFSQFDFGVAIHNGNADSGVSIQIKVGTDWIDYDTFVDSSLAAIKAKGFVSAGLPTRISCPVTVSVTKFWLIGRRLGT